MSTYIFTIQYFQAYSIEDSLGEETALLGSLHEEAEQLLLGNLAIAVLVEPGEGLVEGSLVEVALLHLGVELAGDRLDLFPLEEAAAVGVQLSEKSLHDLLEVGLGNRSHLWYLINYTA